MMLIRFKLKHFRVVLIRYTLDICRVTKKANSNSSWATASC